MQAGKFVPIDCNGPTVAGPATAFCRVSAAIRLRQWRAVTGSHAASDSAHYP